MRVLGKRLAQALVPACLAFAMSGFALAATVDVCYRVDSYQIPAGTFGNPASISLWGFVQTGTGGACTFTTPAPVATSTSVRFPTLTASAGDTLRIHVKNNLPPAVTGVVYTEPVSVVIGGQPASMTPVWIDPTNGSVTGTGSRPSGDVTSRVRSFTAETAQGGTSIYTFGPLRAGTYLLGSGTHPAVQAQMGLYGVLKVLPTTPGRAYADASSAFDSEVSFLLSEIDPVLHDAVATGDYGDGATLTSTKDYHARYFLVNGKPYAAGSPSLQIGSTNRKVLIRLLNAGLDTKVPQLEGQYLSIIAEDGNFLSATGFLGTPPNQVPGSCPAPKQQYSVLLTAGKTVDAILTTPPAAATIPLYDRALNLTNAGASPGGMLAILTTTPAGGGAIPPAPPPTCSLVGAPSGGNPGGGGPNLSLSATSLSFGPLPFSTFTSFSQTRTLTVTNSGTAATISGASITGPDAVRFFIPSPSFPLAVPANSSRTINVTFRTAPNVSRGTKTATLTLTTTDPAHPTFVVSLSGIVQ